MKPTDKEAHERKQAWHLAVVIGALFSRSANKDAKERVAEAEELATELQNKGHLDAIIGLAKLTTRLYEETLATRTTTTMAIYKQPRTRPMSVCKVGMVQPNSPDQLFEVRLDQFGLGIVEGRTVEVHLAFGTVVTLSAEDIEALYDASKGLNNRTDMQTWYFNPL